MGRPLVERSRGGCGAGGAKEEGSPDVLAQSASAPTKKFRVGVSAAPPRILMRNGWSSSVKTNINPGRGDMSSPASRPEWATTNSTGTSQQTIEEKIAPDMRDHGTSPETQRAISRHDLLECHCMQRH